MKKIISILIILISTTMFSQQITVKSAFLEKWENSKNYLVEIAEAMPEAFYDFKPTEREMSFKEQLLHIQSNMEWLGSSYFKKLKIDTSATLSNQKGEIDKATLIENLKTSFDEVKKAIENTFEAELTETVDFFTGPKSKIQILNLLHDHVTHHRGQLIVYLNLKNMQPPKYVGW